MVAMALSCEPKVLLADEPTTAVDVTIQAQLLDLINRLSKERGTAVVIITHNLGVVARYADTVNVMYAGRIVEGSSAHNVYGTPRHPYTLGLLASVPRLDETIREQLVPIEGAPPDLAHREPGCSFRPRCSFAVDACALKDPTLAPKNPGHFAACLVDITSRAPEPVA